MERIITDIVRNFCSCAKSFAHPHPHSQSHLSRLKAILKNHWSKEIWPSSSPGCNPLDYFMWSVVDREVNKQLYITLASLKAKISEVMATRTGRSSFTPARSSGLGLRLSWRPVWISLNKLYVIYMKFSFKCVNPNYLFYCFKCVCRVCPNLSSPACSWLRFGLASKVHDRPVYTKVSGIEVITLEASNILV